MSFEDVQAALINLNRSDAKWILTTNFPDAKRNDDIVTGQWRPINLMLPPFNLPAPIQILAENCLEIEFKDKNLSLWSVEDLKS
jgi:hypothetical protein